MATHEPLALLLADWAATFTPEAGDIELADRALRDTITVTLAARGHPVAQLVADFPEAGRWATVGHVLDFDDLHIPSTAHISAVCVPAALSVGGDARAYLAAAGVMARLGAALGWEHYSSGWHATCTAGAPAAAAGAGVALGLGAAGIATAMALAVPAAGGVQRAFGTDAKSLQVGFATEAGVRAARLAAAGASAALDALDHWVRLVGGDAGRFPADRNAIPGGLAVKQFPCCYALQRPISALRQVTVDPDTVTRVVVRTPAATVQPLIHHRPETGLQGKFSLEYGIAAAILDGYPGFDSFTDAAVRRDAARRLAGRVETRTVETGTDLLTGVFDAEVQTTDGCLRTRLDLPPGSPGRPVTDKELLAKIEECTKGLDVDPATWNWQSAAEVLRAHLPPGREE